MSILFNRRTPVTPRWMLRLFWFLTRKPKFRPLYSPDLVANDMLGQAHFLHEAGYIVAASMVSRAYVECSLKRLAMISPDWEKCRAKSVKELTLFLQEQRLINFRTLNLAENVYAKQSNVCHTGRVSDNNCRSILQDCRSLKKRFEESTQLALSKAV